MNTPLINTIYKKYGEFRKVIQLHGNNPGQSPDVIYLVLNTGRKKSMWLPFWKEWAKDATPVSNDAVPDDIYYPPTRPFITNFHESVLSGLVNHAAQAGRYQSAR